MYQLFSFVIICNSGVTKLYTIDIVFRQLTGTMKHVRGFPLEKLTIFMQYIMLIYITVSMHFMMLYIVERPRFRNMRYLGRLMISVGFFMLLLAWSILQLIILLMWCKYESKWPRFDQGHQHRQLVVLQNHYKVRSIDHIFLYHRIKYTSMT